MSRELSDWIDLTETLEIMSAIDRMMERGSLIGEVGIEALVCRTVQGRSYPVVRLCYSAEGVNVDCAEFEVSVSERTRGNIRYRQSRAKLKCKSLGMFEKLTPAIANSVVEVLST
jgi:hypothetical protein